MKGVWGIEVKTTKQTDNQKSKDKKSSSCARNQPPYDIKFGCLDDY